MNAREDQERASHPYPQGELESPFLEEEIFVGEAEGEWQARLTALEAESAFQHAFEQSPAMPFELENYEEEELSLEGEAPYVGEELEEYDEEEVEDFEWGVEEAPAEFEEAYEDEKPEDIEEETFLDEFDEEDEYILFERQSPAPLRVTKRPRPVPESDPVPFAPPPPRGSYWPIVTSIPQGREVNYLAVDNKGVGSRYGKKGRQFLAERTGDRYHVGVDLWANFNDPVVACQGGKIVAFYGFCCGKKKTTWALLIDHGDVVVNYGEVAPDSLDRAGGLKPGSQVRAGQLIGFIGRNPGGSSMLHFETYKPGTKKNKRWEKGEKRPNELFNPTEHLLFLAEFGLVGRVPPTTPTATPTRRPTPGTAKPPDELVRFAQRVLNAAEGERLAVDGDLGPRTRAALERFRRKYNFGPGAVLDDTTELALAQRALEEIRQQSLFGKFGVLDEATRQELIAFKAERGLGIDATLNGATHTALTAALTRNAAAVSTPPAGSAAPTGGVPSPIPDEIPSRLGTLVFRRDGKTVFRYEFTPEDLLWTARLISGEAGASDDLENRAVIAAMLNRFALFTHRVYPSFTSFLRAYSTPLQPVLRNKKVAQHYMNDPRFRRRGGTYKGTTIPRGQLQQHLELQGTPWGRLCPLARMIALEAMMGKMPDTGIGLASEFASTWILYGRRVGPKNRTEAGWLNYTQKFKRDKGGRWIGHKPHLDQKRNAFFIKRRAANLPPDSVQVVPPT